MPEYVEKRRAAVRVSLPGLDPIDGWLSLAPQAPNHDGPETLLELLNSSQRIIPFILAEAEAVLLVTRANIDWVVAGSDVRPELVCPRTYIVTREEAVTVVFHDGRTIDGSVQMELPQHMNRASDFMNLQDDFFPLRTRLGIVLVNKARVRETRVRLASPLPIPDVS